MLNHKDSSKETIERQRSEKTLRLFVGYDPIEQLPFDVYSYSINKHAKIPVSITQINLQHIPELIYRPHHPKQSNEFAFSRWLVPYLCDFSGWALFTDVDFMSRSDIGEILNYCDKNYACLVVKHQYFVDDESKYLGRQNLNYQRKNWSSCVLWNCGHPNNRILTPDIINQPDTDDWNVGLWLHQFRFLPDELIGELPKEWNHLVSIYPYNPESRLVHWTNYGPWLDGHEHEDYGDEWRANLYKMMDVVRR